MPYHSKNACSSDFFFYFLTFPASVLHTGQICDKLISGCLEQSLTVFRSIEVGLSLSRFQQDQVAIIIIAGNDHASAICRRKNRTLIAHKVENLIQSTSGQVDRRLSQRGCQCAVSMLPLWNTTGIFSTGICAVSSLFPRSQTNSLASFTTTPTCSSALRIASPADVQILSRLPLA